MNNIYIPAYREVAQIARDFGIIDTIPECDDVLVFFINKFFQHIGVVSEQIGDDLAAAVAK